MATSTIAGVNAQGVINAQDPASGIFEIDLQVVSTLTSALQIEMFNRESSQLFTANSNVNNYVPAAPFYLGKADTAGADAAIAVSGATANEWLGGLIVGTKDIYINGDSYPPLAATKNVCFIDVNGNAVWQPGFAAGTQVAGNVILSATQAGVTYAQILEWSGHNTFDMHSAKIEYSENGQIANPLNFVKLDVFGNTDKKQINPKNAKSEDQYNPLLLTPALKQRMTPNRGIQYNLSAYTANSAQTVTFNIFMSVIGNKYNPSTGQALYKLNAD